MNFILKDFFQIGSSNASGRSTDPDVRAKASSSRGLKVLMSASHAGKLTKNFTLYPPSTFQRCAHSFVTPYQKVVQVHHDDQSDPIGRVIGARFLPYQADDFSDSHKDVFLRFQDKVSKTTILDSVRFLEETGVLFDKDWKGLGELELETFITDQLAVEKILDGRYNTVSVGMDPHQVYCSVCNKDWKKDRERCEHYMGEKDEESERLMYLVAGDITGMEVSYINHPADDLAFNKELDLVTMESEIGTGQVYTTDSLDRSNVTYELLDGFSYNEKNDIPKEKVQEEKEEVKIEDQTSEPEEELLTLEKAIATVIEDSESVTEEMSLLVNLAIEDKALTSKERKRLKSKTFCGPDRSYPIDSRARAINALGRVKQHGSSALQKRVRGCVCRKYPGLPACSKSKDQNTEWSQDLFDELNSVIKHPVTNTETTLGQYIFGIEDSLTEQDLKELPDSVFCGPNRSFHIISFDHYEAAMGLLETYQGSGDMAKLKENLDTSKQKLEDEVSAASNEPKNPEEETQQTQDSQEGLDSSSCVLDGLDDEGLFSLFLDMEKEMVSRKLRAPRQCFECEAKDKERKDLEDKVKELEETQSFLRREIKVAALDCQAAEKEMERVTQELTAVYKDSILKCKALTDKEQDVETLKTAVEEMDLTTLKDSFAPTLEGVDSVVEFVRSGLTQEVPTDATVTAQDAEELPKEEVQTGEEEQQYSDLEIVLFKRLSKFRDQNEQLAKRHLLELQTANKIKKELTLDEICKIVSVD